jgi:hypothetical protein
MKKPLLFSLFITLYTFSFSQVGVTIFSSETETQYTLFSELFRNDSYLIDNCGRIINEWKPSQVNGLSSELLPNGNLVRGVKANGSIISQPSTGGAIEIRNWEDEQLWYYEEVDSDYIQHHDFTILPNGNIMFLGWELIYVEEQYALGKDSANVVNPVFWGEYIKEIKPVGNGAEVVWEWHLKDHFVQDINDTLENYGIIAESPHNLDINLPWNPLQFDIVDPYHANALDYNPIRDEVVINMRSIGELWILDHSTTIDEAASDEGGNSGLGGSILFRWGNPAIYQQENAESDWKLYGSHGTNFINEGLPDQGKIIFFNNGLFRPDGEYSTIEILEPALDVSGSYYLDANGQFAIEEHKIVYGSDKSLKSDYISNAHQTTNGNIFINEGDRGRLLEVDQEENIIWEYKVPFSQGFPLNQSDNNAFYLCFKAFRYGEDYITNDEIDLSPGDFIEQNVESNFCDLVNIEDGLISFQLKKYKDRIEINQIIPKEKINIVSLNGQLVNFSYTIKNDYTEVGFSELQHGIYVIYFENKNGMISQYKFAVL